MTNTFFTKLVHLPVHAITSVQIVPLSTFRDAIGIRIDSPYVIINNLYKYTGQDGFTAIRELRCCEFYTIDQFDAAMDTYNSLLIKYKDKGDRP